MKFPTLALITSIVLAGAAAGCGGGGGGGSTSGPSAPSPTVSSVAVTVASPLKMGTTTQATGTASLSNGQSQSVTTGWRSDATAVASVTDAGLVTGVANGRATIYVVSGGRQGQQVIRVVPDYEGQWSGWLLVTGCTQSGAWAEIGFCELLPPGSQDPFGLGASQAGELLTARASYSSLALLFNPATAPIEGDGTASFSTTGVTSDGLIIDATWRVNAPQVGSLTGTVVEAWRVAGVAGEGRLVQDIVNAARTGTRVSESDVSRGGSPAKRRAARRLIR